MQGAPVPSLVRKLDPTSCKLRPSAALEKVLTGISVPLSNLKSYNNFYLFTYFLATPRSRDLSSPTRDQTHTPHSRSVES